MAGEMNEIVAQGSPQPDLAGRWRNWLADPVNRASLLQTGIALLQPMTGGQSPIGHIASSIGQGAALQGRYQEAVEAQRDREMKREAQQLASREAEARIANYGVDNDLQKQNIALRQEEIEAAREGRVWNRELALKQFALEEKKANRERTPTLTEIMQQDKYEEEKRTARSRWIDEQAKIAAEGALPGEPKKEEYLNDPAWRAKTEAAYDSLFGGAQQTSAAPGVVKGPKGPSVATGYSYKGVPMSEADVSELMARTGWSREQTLQFLSEAQ